MAVRGDILLRGMGRVVSAGVGIPNAKTGSNHFTVIRDSLVFDLLQLVEGQRLGYHKILQVGLVKHVIE